MALTNIRRGDIWLVDLNDAKGSEQGGVRPAIIMQNDIGNKHSPTTLIVPLTSKIKSSMSATHTQVLPSDGVRVSSEAECEQVRVVDKTRLRKHIGTINNRTVLEEINSKLAVALGFAE